MDKLDREMILIQRRHREQEEPVAHGIWKIAFADFMTAMMAFFLIMWLMNSTSEEEKTSVANYFNPIKLSSVASSIKGIEDPQETSRELLDDKKAMTPSRTLDASSGASENMTGDSAHADKPGFPDTAMFMDPYAILAKLADDEVPAKKVGGSEASPLEREAPPGSDTVRDPFDPAYWRIAPNGQPSAVSQKEASQAGTASYTEAAPGGNAIPVEAQPGEHQVSELKAEIADALRQESGTPGTPEIGVEISDDGILISLTDAETFSMFDVGSARPKPAVVRAIARVADVLAKRPGMIVIRGHTDSLPFRSDSYDNWRLSSARAHMASYMLVRGGLKEERIERIEGWADRQPRNPADTRAPENRRIEILLREKRT